MTKPLELVAYDGADDDGGTLYVLHGAGELLSASWPQPLEAWARENGYDVVRRRRDQDDVTLLQPRRPA